MTIYTGTAYLFRATIRPDKADGPERADYLEHVQAISGRHRFSYGCIGKKLADVEEEVATMDHDEKEKAGEDAFGPGSTT